MRNRTRFRRVIVTMKEGLVAVSLLLAANPANLVAQSSEKKTLAGVWEVKISAGGVQSPLLSIAIFGQDGSFATAGNTKFSLAPPNQGLGAWSRVRALVSNGRQRVQTDFLCGPFEGRRSERIHACP
jgi:hypothetical protein